MGLVEGWVYRSMEHGRDCRPKSTQVRPFYFARVAKTVCKLCQNLYIHFNSNWMWKQTFENNYFKNLTLIKLIKKKMLLSLS